MIVNGVALNSVPLNAELSTLPATGTTVISLIQVVANPAGSTTLTLQQNIGSTGATTLTLQQNIFDESALAYENWDCLIRVDGVDIGDSVTGAFEMDAEMGAARLASFTVKLSGVVNVDDWTGKPVTVDWVQSNGAHWRRFTGVIIAPVINLNNMTLTCQCSDDLQRIADMHTTEQLKTLAGGRWSKYVFSEDAVGWRYLQDVLSTVPVSVQRNALGHLRATSWQCAAVPHYTFDADDILNDSDQIALAQRFSMINRVDIELDARFERLYHRNARFFWVHNVTFCDWWADPVLMPTQDMVRSAVESAGWSMLAEAYVSLWPSGAYACIAQGYPTVVFTNLTPDIIRQFNIRAANRWQQSVTNRYKITVKDAASIAAYGELPTSLRSAVEFVSDEPQWDEALNAATPLPTGFITDDQHNQYRDEYDQAAFNNAVQTVVDVAIETIAKSHRSALPTLELALRPYLELGQTIEIDDNMECKGVLSRIRERYEFDTGRAVSSIDITLSVGKSGLERVTNSYSVPTWPVQIAAAGSAGVITVPSHFGGKSDAPVLAEDDWGVITNYEVLEVDAEIYPRELRLAFDAIPDSKTQNRIDEIPVEILIQTPQNTLTITA